MNEVESERRDYQGLVAAVGAVCGLLAGLLATQGTCRVILRLGSHELANTTWQIASPLMAIVGAVGGAWLFKRLFGRQLIPAIITGIFLLVLLGALCAWLGFPWIGEP